MEPKYTYSQLSANSAAHLVAFQYDLPKFIDCKFYVFGLHDNYLIEDEHKKYILRIYRNDWRSEQEIQFELELLAFLGTKDVLVATPLTTNTGGLSFFIDSPEGKRVAALFHYADGYAPGNEITVAQSALLGKAVANVHQITNTYETGLSRHILDVPYLLDQSIIAIQPFIDIEAKNYIYTLQNKLKDDLPSLPRKTGVFGICIGDVNPTNFHINDKKEITLFDFDQCGYGNRVFEIGKFISSIHPTKTKHEISSTFIEGYQQVRQLSDAELSAIPYYEMLSVIWVMAIHAYNADRIGHKYLEKSFWDRRIAKLKELDKLMPNKQIQPTQKSRG